VKVNIDCDEWYPVYHLRDGAQEAELSEKDEAKVQAAFVAFEEAQEILRTALCVTVGHKRTESKWKWIDGKSVHGDFAWCSRCYVDLDAPVVD
jgi:hypothetical protein